MREHDKEQDVRLARIVASGGKLRALLLELWQRTRLDWSFVSDRLSVTFRRERSLGSSERRFVAETLYGLVRHLRRIDAALAAGVRRGASRPRDEHRLLAYLVLECGLPPAEAARVVPELDWNAVRAIDGVIAADRKATSRIAIGCSLPDWLAARLVADWGDEAEALARGLNARAPMTVRANTLKTTRAALAAALAADGIATTEGRWASHALHLETRVNLFGLEAFQRGELEAQDEGSQLLAELVDPPPRGTTVDFCAGAGGKTLALAAATGGKGRVVASDVDPAKLDELRRRARRAGVANAQAVALDPDPTAPLPPALADVAGKVDRVLVDAPCSGVGALRRNPEARWRLAEDELASFAARQLAIARRAAALLAPGGRLVYATCTVLRVENAAVVDALRAARPELEVVPLAEVLGARAAALAGADGRFLEVAPHRHGTDGFFGAVLRRPA
jgi:16S rRNA (cytosine967-C5)-methyltransferase